MKARPLYLFILLIFLSTSKLSYAFYQKSSPKIDNSLEQKTTLTPCIKALLDDNLLKPGSNLEKNAHGTLTVEDFNESKIFFNVILKTKTGKKNDPPIYLRFIKVEQIDIRKVLEYAKSGDEIFIEQYTTSKSQHLICAPSSLTVT
ncbi:MAG: hypothetical protein M9887_09060 [Chitinophagales bacterium]|nr:hypothetical protein [Chitinophagales bacterium]